MVELVKMEDKQFQDFRDRYIREYTRVIVATYGYSDNKSAEFASDLHLRN